MCPRAEYLVRMSDASQIVLLKKSVRFWRACFFLIFMFSILIIPSCDFSNFSSFKLLNNQKGGYIARIYIEGPIYDSIQRDNVLKKIADDSDITGVIVHINSPGGGTSASESLYNNLRKISKNKPIVSVLGPIATSGAYMAAIATDVIFARNTTTTCSIGVLIEYLNFSSLFEKLGISSEYIRSGIFKASPSSFTQMTQEERDYLQSIIQEDFSYFASLVSERRGLPIEKIISYQGKSCSGRGALAESLIDYLGYEDEALDWLREKGINGNVVDMALTKNEYRSSNNSQMFMALNRIVEYLLYAFGRI